LGIILDNKLSFNSHVDYIVDNCFKKWSTLKRICENGNYTVFLRLYKSYILPLIDYCNICWIRSNNQIDSIERIRRQITKFICCKMGYYNLSYKDRLKLLNLKPLQLRNDLCILKYVFKSIYNYNNICVHWKNFFVTNNTRNGLVISNINTRINLCDKNFFVYAIKLFNSLPIDIRNEQSFICYKSKLELFLLRNMRCF
jgi:hypothetical protein